jgi:hypothetical protein
MQSTQYTECNSGKTQKLPLGDNDMTGLQNITTTSDNTGTLVNLNVPHYMSI